MKTFLTKPQMSFVEKLLKNLIATIHFKNTSI